MDQIGQKIKRFFDTGIGGIVYIFLICLISFIIINLLEYIYPVFDQLFNGNAQAAYKAGNAYLGDILTTAALYGPFIADWIVLLLLITIPKHNRYMLKRIMPGKGNRLSFLLGGFLLGFAMNFCIALAAMLNGDIKLSFHDFNILPFIFLLVLVFIQSSSEELFCRCYFYEKILERYPNKWIPALLNSAAFSAMHLMNPGLTAYSLLNVFLSGLLFSLMIMYWDSLWCAMACHTGWNFTQNILLGLPNSGFVVPYSVFRLEAASARDSFAYSISFGIEGSLMAVILLTTVIAAVVWYNEVKKKKEAQNEG